MVSYSHLVKVNNYLSASSTRASIKELINVGSQEIEWFLVDTIIIIGEEDLISRKQDYGKWNLFCKPTKESVVRVCFSAQPWHSPLKSSRFHG